MEVIGVLVGWGVAGRVDVEEGSDGDAAGGVEEDPMRAGVELSERVTLTG
ncbi:MAG: hypothetical protein JNK87_20970 [Bryobacterales bacterium]|nr:hypothetical protein [Bryobacterales bacterium]